MLFEQLGIEVWFDDAPYPGITGLVFHPYRSTLIKSGDITLGIMGELHPKLLQAYNIKAESAAFELDFEVLADKEIAEKEFKFIPKFPAIQRDIALLVPTDTKIDTVIDVIENTAGLLLEDTDVFDIYEGPELPDEKKSLAFTLTFQADDRTLRDEEVEAIMQKIITTLEENVEWEVRK